jgi:uncharacterized membrane protein
MNYILSFLAGFTLLVTLDFLFLGYLMADYYKKLISPAATIQFNLLPAFLFYFLYTIGVFYFVVQLNLAAGNVTKIFLTGLFFGFVCYMTYDLTNYATLKDWPLKLVFVDIAWGSFVTALVALAAYIIIS